MKFSEAAKILGCDTPAQNIAEFKQHLARHNIGLIKILNPDVVFAASEFAMIAVNNVGECAVWQKSPDGVIHHGNCPHPLAFYIVAANVAGVK